MPDPFELDEPQIADASGLLAEERAPTKAKRAPAPDVSQGTYDVDAGEARPSVRPPTPAPRRTRTAAEPAVPPRTRHVKDGVTTVWSRSAEWRPDVIRLAIFGGVAVVLIYGLAAMGLWTVAFLALLTSLAAAAFLAYPLVITLERPVRMTPERAVRDYFAALSHSFPHYRRMWLLLSDQGHASGDIQSEADLRAHWNARRVELSRNGRPSYPALLFDVTSYEGEKAGGESHVNATVTLDVRESSNDGSLNEAIATFQFPVTLTRGPDNHWYLDTPIIPEGN